VTDAQTHAAPPVSAPPLPRPEIEAVPASERPPATAAASPAAGEPASPPLEPAQLPAAQARPEPAAPGDSPPVAPAEVANVNVAPPEVAAIETAEAVLSTAEVAPTEVADVKVAPAEVARAETTPADLSTAEVAPTPVAAVEPPSPPCEPATENSPPPAVETPPSAPVQPPEPAAEAEPALVPAASPASTASLQAARFAAQVRASEEVISMPTAATLPAPAAVVDAKVAPAEVAPIKTTPPELLTAEVAPTEIGVVEPPSPPGETVIENSRPPAVETPPSVPVEPPEPAAEAEPALVPAASPASAASPQAALFAPQVRADESISMPTAATLPAPAASQGPVPLPWKSDRLPLIIGAAGHRDLREGDVAKLKSAVASVISTLRRQYLGNDKQTPIVLLSALGEGAEQLIAGEALKQGATLIVPLPLPLSEYRRDFTQRPLAPDAIKHFDDLRLKATATVEIPLAAGSSESGVRVFGPERDRQHREANLFIARHCHVLIALYDGNDDDITVGGAAETVKFNRDGIPGGIRESAHSALDGAEIGPVIHIVTPRKAVKTTASEVRVVPWGTKAKGASPRGLGRVFTGAAAKKPADLTVEEARSARAWAQFRAIATLTTRFNREAKARARKRETEIALDIARLFGGNTQAQARAETAATQWCRFYGLTDTLAREREKRVRGDWRDMFLLGFAALFCFALYSHLFPVNLLLLDYAVISGVVFIFFFRARLREHRQRFLDYRALADALRVGVFWKFLGIGTVSGSAPSASPHRISVARAYPMSQPNELAWVQAMLRGLDLADRIALPVQPPRVALDAYGWTREFWVGGQREFYRALEARCGRIAEQRQRWGVMLLIASAALAAALSATDIYDEMTGRASTIMAWAEGSAAFITSHMSFLPAGVTTFINQFAAQTYPVLVFVIGLLPGIAAVIVGYAAQMAFKARSRYCAQMAWRFERALELLPESHHVGRKSIMAGVLEPELSAYCQAIFTELGTAAMRSSAEWVAIHRDHVIG
jgi:hypothetical protein